jgi:nitrate reductase delta subunit
MVAMASTANESRVLALFADLLEYPRRDLDVAQTARECRALIASESAEAATLLGEFVTFAERTPPDMIEEVFSATFDLNASCHPYVGYQLFGEAYPRSIFMLELKDRYRNVNYDPGVELPDHIAVMLRYMSMSSDAESNGEIAREGLLATLEAMTLPPETAAEDERDVPELYDVGKDYRRVLKALRLVLQARYGAHEQAQPIPIPDAERLIS